jgi:hypothetical protein
VQTQRNAFLKFLAVQALALIVALAVFAARGAL